MENAGVDQVVFIQQAGMNRHEDICESLELFADKILPDFKKRNATHIEQKNKRLENAITAAESNTPALTSLESTPIVDSYPVLKKKLEEKVTETTEPEMSEDGKNFLLSIEGGPRNQTE